MSKMVILRQQSRNSQMANSSPVFADGPVKKAKTL